MDQTKRERSYTVIALERIMVAGDWYSIRRDCNVDVILHLPEMLSCLENMSKAVSFDQFFGHRRCPNASFPHLVPAAVYFLINHLLLGSTMVLQFKPLSHQISLIVTTAVCNTDSYINIHWMIISTHCRHYPDRSNSDNFSALSWDGFVKRQSSLMTSHLSKII